MKNKINYSFVIPHKNTPQLLVRCLNSIPARDDVEIIVVDDDSNDIDWAELNKSIIPTYQLILNKDAGGAGHARNIGLDAYCGRWLIFADSDDFFTTDCNEILDEYMDSEADLIFFNVDSVYSDNIEEHALRTEGKNKLIADYYANPSKENEDKIRFKYTEPWAKIYKADLIKTNNIRFSETYVCNDMLFSIQCACAAKNIVVDKRILYVCTFRKDSLCADTFKVYNKALCRLSETAKSQHFIEQHYHVVDFYLLDRVFISFVRCFPLSFMVALKIIIKSKVNKWLLLKAIYARVTALK